MEINTQSHFWWLESHNNSKCSPWLQSTLSELNEKTKAMLKLIEEDADSFAQRAEMYYKKRPELTSMVEDFYRAQRSLAERYDQLKSDHAVRIRPPLRQSNSLPKLEDEYVSDSVNSEKSFDSWTEGGYSSEAAAEFEVDDPGEEVDARGNQEVDEIERDFSDGASNEEVMKLKDELDRLREENEIQKNVIRKKDEEKEELVNRFLDNIGELREEMRVIREENLIVLKKTSNVSESFGEVTTRKDENDKLKMEDMYQQVEEKAEKDEVTKKFEVENYKLMKMEKEGLTNNGYFESAVAVKEEETEATREFEVTYSELNERRSENVHLNATLVSKYEDEAEMRHLKDAIVTKDGGNCETIKLLNDGAERDTGKEVIKLLKIELAEKNETIRRLSDALLEKDADKNESIRQLNDKLVEVDAEKNEAIMRLSDTLLEKDADKNESIRQLNDKLAEVNAEKNEAIRLLKEAIIEKEEKNEAIRQLNNALEEKGEEIRELIRQMNNALEEKDEDKREVIRQLSVAMEILREESKHLKKILVNKSLSKKSSGFEIFKGINLGKIFGPSANFEASVPQM